LQFRGKPGGENVTADPDTHSSSEVSKKLMGGGGHA
jgi:hypothetical protein